MAEIDLQPLAEFLILVAPFFWLILPIVMIVIMKKTEPVEKLQLYYKVINSDGSETFVAFCDDACGSDSDDGGGGD